LANQTEQPNRVQVFYDGACPICSREISFYRSLRGAGAIIWTDLSGAGQSELPRSIERIYALRRIHAIDANGQVVSGARVFSLIWSALPQFRLLGFVSRLPLVNGALDVLYWAFLKILPTLKKALRKKHG
jgi:predicted DCC family thiol-disulfide oxidoreductase YuxK